MIRLPVLLRWSRLRAHPAEASKLQGVPGPVQLLDQQIVALLRDGRLRTGAQIAEALGAALPAVDAAIERLAGQRRVLKAGYTLPQQPGYGVAWPKLWGLARPPT